MAITYRTLGRNGVKVSPVCLGTMMFGQQTDEDMAARIVDRARAQGVNFIDTANVYNDGASEEVVGRLVSRDRDDWVVATKYVNSRHPGPNRRGASRKNTVEAVEASLGRLGTDYIDLMYLHRQDHSTPIAETVQALGDLIRAGKLRYWGLSNHPAWKIAEFCRTADALGVPRPAASQPCYNLANRQPETDISERATTMAWVSALQPARARGANGQVYRRPGSGGRNARWPERQADVRDGVARGVARSRRADQGAC